MHNKFVLVLLLSLSSIFFVGSGARADDFGFIDHLKAFIHPYWTPETKAQYKQAQEEIEKAQERRGPPAPRDNSPPVGSLGIRG
tara:strand:- start:3267 stop:3518 length:252 start_codon:yes stop_codon:yes gene_type:complete